mmetsp:Transcript_32952/g.50400  ORF Transcript_32952/g.50400 Transcript_32952/m.50400 type:complete len:92 (+) Transcript_32952:1085-1360(+)
MMTNVDREPVPAENLSYAEKAEMIMTAKANSTVLTDKHELEREVQYFDQFMYFHEDFVKRVVPENSEMKQQMEKLSGTMEKVGNIMHLLAL